ncbi:hypothetical protein [Streptomyces sp. NPDC048508]|uniref:hypothetical protein n=1 Tax=Streptomyces sp. NPDC048508 TaxID=3365561 RepID=UPI00371F0458
MVHPTLNRQQQRRLARLAIGIGAAIILTACMADTETGASAGESSPSQRSTPRGVVTVNEASALLTNYENANNRANATRNQKLLATVEGGQLHAQSIADYEQYKTLPKKDQVQYGLAFHYTHRKYLIPAEGTATWFAVRATVTGSTGANPALLIFDRIGNTYKMVLAIHAEKSSIPEVSLDKNGLATPADPAKPVGDLAPNQLGSAYEDLVETGGKKSGSKLALTPVAKDSLKIYSDRDKRDNSKYATNRYFAKPPKDPSVYALQLADGGVLAAFSSAHTVETMLRPAYMSSFKINPDAREAVYNPSKRVVITDEYQGQGLATLIRSGKARITAREYRMVDSR